MKLKKQLGQKVKYFGHDGVVSYIDRKEKTFYAEFNYKGKIKVVEFYWYGSIVIGGMFNDWEKCI